ncbi:MAG: hypothetical protein RI897_4342 [Verrucomicrobiota bacterium]|jgi:hypothetical protein
MRSARRTAGRGLRAEGCAACAARDLVASSWELGDRRCARGAKREAQRPEGWVGSMNVVPKDNRMNAASHEWPGWVQGWVYSCVDYSCG